MITTAEMTNQRGLATTFTSIGLALGVASIAFYALNRLALRYPQLSVGIGDMPAAIFAIQPLQAFAVGGTISLIGLACGLTTRFFLGQDNAMSMFVTGLCGSSIVFGFVLTI